MKSVAKALYSFYSGFGLPAYPEESVPSDAQLPYITYTVVQPDWNENAIHQARVWYRSESYAGINAKTDEILTAIGRGKLLPAGDGYVCLRPGTPLVQFQPIEDPLLKVTYINLQLNAFLTR